MKVTLNEQREENSQTILLHSRCCNEMLRECRSKELAALLSVAFSLASFHADADGHGNDDD